MKTSEHNIEDFSFYDKYASVINNYIFTKSHLIFLMKIEPIYTLSNLSKIALILCSFYSSINILAQTTFTTEELIDLTVENNPRFKISLQSLKYSKGSYKVARSDFNTNIILNIYFIINI